MSPTPLRFLLFYVQARFWSMGEGKGTPSFERTLTSLAGRGHEVHVFLPSHDDGGELRAPRIPGLHFHPVEPSGRFIPRAALPLTRRMYERFATWRRYQEWAVRHGEALARTLDPHLLLSLGAFEAPAARTVGETLGIPNVIRLYGSWLPLEKSHRYYANFPALQALRTPAVAHLITDDGSGGDRIARRAGVPDDRLFFPRNGLDLDHFAPCRSREERRSLRTRLGIPANAPVVVSATRLSVEKKLERLFGSLPELLRLRPDTVVLVVGDGDERPRLERLLSELGVAGAVRFVGAVPHEEVPAYLRAGDLLVSLLDRTNTNNPVLEAMAAGIPPLVLETGATREVIESGVSGWILAPQELPSLAQRLADLLSNPGALIAAGHAARARIERIVPSVEERLSFEVALYEAAALRQALPRWDRPR